MIMLTLENFLDLGKHVSSSVIVFFPASGDHYTKRKAGIGSAEDRASEARGRSENPAGKTGAVSVGGA